MTKAILAAALFPVVAAAQAPQAQPAPTDAPTYVFMAGGSYTPGTRPSAMIVMGVRVKDNTFSYTTQSWVPTKLSLKNPQLTPSVRTGLATDVFHSGGWHAMLLSDAGASGTGTGGVAASFSGGGVVVYRFKSDLCIAAEARVLKTNTGSVLMVGVLFGKVFK